VQTRRIPVAGGASPITTSLVAPAAAAQAVSQ
jgi:hypothetical protein